MKAETPLESRIHRIRRTLRARQPLEQRINLVRSRHRALRLARGEGKPSPAERKS